MSSDSTDDVASLDGAEPSSLPSASKSDLLVRYLRSLSSIPRITREEEKELSQQIKEGGKQGQAAFEQLVRANLLLVVTIARRSPWRRIGVPLLDLIQEGNLGLMRAAQLYDGEQGVAFSTFAGGGINFAIMSSRYSQPGGMGYPSGVRQQIAKMQKVRKKFAQDKQRDPTEEELAAALGMRLRNLWKLQMAARQPVPLETPVDKQEKALSLAERISCPQASWTAEQLDGARLGDPLFKALAKLSADEGKLIKLRFGLEDGKDQTHKEISDRLGITEKRVRALLVRAMRKLKRSPLLRRAFREYLGR